MIDTPKIVQTTAVQTAFIHLTVPRREIQSVMGPGLGELMAALRTQGISPAGPWFTHHLRMDPATFDFEICWVAAQGRKPASWLWEVYLTDPQLLPDPATWRTQLNRPLAG